MDVPNSGCQWTITLEWTNLPMELYPLNVDTSIFEQKTLCNAMHAILPL